MSSRAIFLFSMRKRTQEFKHVFDKLSFGVKTRLIEAAMLRVNEHRLWVRSWPGDDTSQIVFATAGPEPLEVPTGRHARERLHEQLAEFQASVTAFRRNRIGMEFLGETLCVRLDVRSLPPGYVSRSCDRETSW